MLTLDGFRRYEDKLRQSFDKAEITLSLGPNGHICTLAFGADSSVGTQGEQARRFVSTHHAALRAMLQEGVEGNFRADHRGIMWNLSEKDAEARVWFALKHDAEPVLYQAKGVDQDTAKAQARNEFRALSRKARNRLFAIARASER